MTNNTPNEIILARSYNDSIGEIKEVFDRALIVDKVEFIGWFLDNFDSWLPRNVNLADYSIEEISEATGLSREYVSFVGRDAHASDYSTDRLVFQFSQNVPILQLSKITSINPEKIERIRELRSKHPHCFDELLALYFEIQNFIKKECLEEFIGKKPGRKKRIENLSTNEIKRKKDQEIIKEKLALFLKKKKTRAFDEIEEILEIKHKTLKNIVSAHFSKKCLSNPSCPYQRYLKI